MVNNITCSTNCKYRTAVILFVYPSVMVCLWYITVNILYDDDDDDDDDDDENDMR